MARLWGYPRALLARVTSRSAGLSESFGEFVERLVLATRHFESPKDLNEQIIVDIDLAILGQPSPRFHQYEREIREEYSWVPVDAFANGGARILSSILARPEIYSIAFFHRKYEIIARENLERSIARLAAG